MDLPWETGIVKQIKDIFLCDILECNVIEDNEEIEG